MAIEPIDSWGWIAYARLFCRQIKVRKKEKKKEKMCPPYTHSYGYGCTSKQHQGPVVKNYFCGLFSCKYYALSLPSQTRISFGVVVARAHSWTGQKILEA